MFQEEFEQAKSLLLDTILATPVATFDGLIHLSQLQTATAQQAQTKEYFSLLNEEIETELENRKNKDNETPLE